MTRKWQPAPTCSDPKTQSASKGIAKQHPMDGSSAVTEPDLSYFDDKNHIEGAAVGLSRGKVTTRSMGSESMSLSSVSSSVHGIRLGLIVGGFAVLTSSFL